MRVPQMMATMRWYQRSRNWFTGCKYHAVFLSPAHLPRCLHHISTSLRLDWSRRFKPNTSHGKRRKMEYGHDNRTSHLHLMHPPSHPNPSILSHDTPTTSTHPYLHSLHQYPSTNLIRVSPIQIEPSRAHRRRSRTSLRHGKDAEETSQPQAGGRTSGGMGPRTEESSEAVCRLFGRRGGGRGEEGESRTRIGTDYNTRQTAYIWRFMYISFGIHVVIWSSTKWVAYRGISHYKSHIDHHHIVTWELALHSI
jgi:hypothetical protein